MAGHPRGASEKDCGVGVDGGTFDVSLSENEQLGESVTLVAIELGLTQLARMPIDGGERREAERRGDL
jgi:hypothetical protein